ncbi:hypothetical protein ABTM90_19550, partial [Acinetobacter baumannii]
LQFWHKSAESYTSDQFLTSPPDTQNIIVPLADETKTPGSTKEGLKYLRHFKILLQQIHSIYQALKANETDPFYALLLVCFRRFIQIDNKT